MHGGADALKVQFIGCRNGGSGNFACGRFYWQSFVACRKHVGILHSLHTEGPCTNLHLVAIEIEIITWFKVL